MVVNYEFQMISFESALTSDKSIELPTRPDTRLTLAANTSHIKSEGFTLSEALTKLKEFV